MNVLLVGNSDRSSLAAARSLGRAGWHVDIGNLEEGSAATYSRFTKKVWEIGDPSCSVSVCIRNLCSIVGRQSYDVVLPLTDPACLLVQQDRTALEKKSHVGLPSSETFSYAHDKGKLLELCEELQVPYPMTERVTTYQDFIQKSDRSYPLFAKPVHSSIIKDDRIVSFRPRLVNNHEELDAFVRGHIGSVPLLLQEVVPGWGVGVYLLADKGKILSITQQERLHEPRTGGGSSYRITVPLNSVLKDYTQRLVERMKWSGPAMLEFRGIPEENRWWVMELNGRFWGSLPLTIASGLDYPLWWCQHLVGQKAELISPSIGKRQRHLGKDLAWLKSVFDEGKPSSLLPYLKDFKHLLKGNEQLDVETIRDPLPGLGYWIDKSFSPLSKVGKAFCRLKAWSLYRKREKGDLDRLQQLCRKKEDPHLLIICRGNICRSPFAEELLKQLYKKKNVRSVGSYPVSDRKVPSHAEQAAKRFRVDLTHHISKRIEQRDIDWAEAILVMDLRNYEELITEFGDNITKPVVFLGALVGRKIIHDPFNKSLKHFEEAYKTIAGALKELVDG